MRNARRKSWPGARTRPSVKSSGINRSCVPGSAFPGEHFMRSTVIRTGMIRAAAISLLCAASPALGQRQPPQHAPALPRFANTLLIRKWVKQYGCPESASRLAPITIWPANRDFSTAEACAVARRAHDAWMNADSLTGTRIDPRDTLPVTGIVVSHPHFLILSDAPSQRAKWNTGFTVTFYRGHATAVIVGFDRNMDAGPIGPGHPQQPGFPPG